MRIGICSPGLGFLSLARLIRQDIRPAELVLYCDNANAPYGSRPAHQVRTLVQHMLDSPELRSCDRVIVNCNTSSLSLPDLVPPKPTVGVILPAIAGIERRFSAKDAVLLLGTPATINAKLYEHALRGTGAAVHPVALPDLARTIDSGDASAQDRAISEALRDRFECTCAMLACTHYPLAAERISRFLDSHFGRHIDLVTTDPWVCAHLIPLAGPGAESTHVQLVCTKKSALVESLVRESFSGCAVESTVTTDRDHNLESR